MKNRVPQHVEETTIEMAIQCPAYGQARATNALKKQEILLSPGGVRSIWQRQDMETFKKPKRLES